MHNTTATKSNTPPPRRALKLRSRTQAPPTGVRPPVTLIRTWLALLDSDDNHVRNNARRNIFSYFSSVDDAKSALSEAEAE